MIEVRRRAEGDPLELDVAVREGGGESRHLVTMSRADCERLAGGREPEQVIEAAFRFCSTASRRRRSSAAST